MFININKAASICFLHAFILTFHAHGMNIQEMITDPINPADQINQTLGYIKDCQTNEEQINIQKGVLKQPLQLPFRPNKKRKTSNKEFFQLNFSPDTVKKNIIKQANNEIMYCQICKKAIQSDAYVNHCLDERHDPFSSIKMAKKRKTH